MMEEVGEAMDDGNDATSKTSTRRPKGDGGPDFASKRKQHN